jgi:hypothetical protein
MLDSGISPGSTRKKEQPEGPCLVSVPHRAVAAPERLKTPLQQPGGESGKSIFRLCDRRYRPLRKSARLLAWQDLFTADTAVINEQEARPMQRLFPQKLLTIITMDTLEETLSETVRRRGASGYTVVQARGAGSSGEVSGELDVDTSIKFHVIVPAGRMSGMLDDLEELLRAGHHITAFVSDVAVLGPGKFDKPLLDPESP